MASECLCNLGYTGQVTGSDVATGSCVACPKGQFKAVVADVACKACPEWSDTATDTSMAASDCYCLPAFTGTISGSDEPSGRSS